jgi:two-component system chemotaxis sensor kinase CheA
MSALNDQLERIAERYLLEDFAGVEAGLAELSARRMPSEEAARMEELRLASLRLREAPEEASGREAFENALDRLRGVLDGSTEGAQPEAATATSSVLSQDPELVGDFLLEAREHLQNVENGLLIIEKDPSHRETLHSVFRSFHTIKGLAGFLEFEAIQQISHEVETILDLARNGEIEMTPALIDLTLEGSDFVSSEMKRIEAELRGEFLTAREGGDLLRRLQAAAQTRNAGEPQAPSREALRREAEPVPEGMATLEESSVATTACRDATTPQAEPRDHAVVEALSSPGKAAPPATEIKGVKRSAPAEMHAIRVDTSKLDYLLDMVGEMVIAESMVRLDPELAVMKNARLQRNLTQLRRVTEEVQKVAMATRMLPVASLFQRVNRLVRDTSRKAGKLAEVEFFGEDTQLDKTIIEELTDPIMHMVRNSIDHGIETPAQRQANSKPAAGTIQLKAYRQADHIQIEIVDDGRGLNKEKILAKATERGLIAEGASLADADVFQLIFEPGFSTAEKVTDLSGRGVGMDVVKKQIQKLRGKIDIQSEAGRGTTFFLKLPLTLAIIEGLVVGVGRERFIVPIYSVQEMFRPAGGQLSTVQGRGEMVMVRNALLPVVRLEDSLQVQGSGRPSQEGLMIVAETEGKRFVLVVDEFIGKQEVVIKSLGASLKNTAGVAGGAILGDGRVGLILDLEAIYRDRHHRDRQQREGRPHDGPEPDALPHDRPPADGRPRDLEFDYGRGREGAASSRARRKESICVQELALSLS